MCYSISEERKVQSNEKVKSKTLNEGAGSKRNNTPDLKLITIIYNIAN